MRYHETRDNKYHTSKQTVIDIILNTNTFKPFKEDEKLFRKMQIHRHKVKTEHWNKVGRGLLSKKGTSGVTGVTKPRDNRWIASYREAGTKEPIHLGVFESDNLIGAIKARYEAELIYGATEHSNSLVKLIELGEVVE